jgi:Uma2 family endonuclease
LLVPKLRERPATYEDLLKVPDHMVAEIVEGELFASPRPASRHARAMNALDRRLGPAFEDGGGGPGGWWIITEPELHLGDDVLVPDLAGWRRARMPNYPDVAAFDLAPDWVCEILSPSTARLDRVRKLPRYAYHEIEYAWIVDPIARMLEVFRRNGEHFAAIAAFEGEEVVRAEPFDAIEIDLATVWIPA